MSQYTTGEIAKLCNVSVRTVQYYDSREILVPSALSEGGRRLYSQEDLEKLKIICFLRELELPIDSIKSLFEEKHPEKVISMLLDEREAVLRQQITQKQQRVDDIAEIRKSMAKLPGFSVNSIKDIAHMMKNKKRLRRLRVTMLILGFVMDAIEVSTAMLWAVTGIWWPFALGMAAAIALGVYIAAMYFRSTAYICPECHTVFKSTLRESFWAPHTPNTRRLTCTHCSHRGFCVETYGRKEDYAEN